MSYLILPLTVFMLRMGVQDTQLEDLLSQLRSKDPSVRIASARKLAELKTLPARAAEALLDAFEDPEGEVRWNAVFAIRRAAVASPKAIERLVGRLGDELDIEAEAERALATIGLPALNELIRALRAEKQGFPAWKVFGLLGELGSGAKNAIPDLEKALKRENVFDRYHAAQAVVRIDPNNKAPEPILVDALRRAELEWQLFGAENLARTTHSKSKEALSLLVKTVQDEKADLNHFIRACVALGYFGPAGEKVVPRLEEVMNQKRLVAAPAFRILLAGSILKIDAGNKTARSVLKENEQLLREAAGRKASRLISQFATEVLKIYLAHPTDS
jgi:hypothetical protein